MCFQTAKLSVNLNTQQKQTLERHKIDYEVNKTKIPATFGSSKEEKVGIPNGMIPLFF